MNPFFLWFRGSCNHDGRNKIATRLGGIEKLPFKVRLLNHNTSLVSARTTDTRRLNPEFFAAQIQISIQNKYLGCGYEGLVLVEIMVFENMDKGFIEPKWVLIFENTPNASEFICPICLPKPKSSVFQWKKASLGVRSPWVNALFRDHP